jgi:hypothetical protein
MLVNIWVKDNCTGYVHQVGTDPHDSLECWNGVVQYVNLQCMEGTMGGGFSFVEPTDLDDYVSVTPDVLLMNRQLIHHDLQEWLKKHPEAIKKRGGKNNA